MNRITGLPPTVPARSTRTVASPRFQPTQVLETAAPAQASAVAPPLPDRRGPDRRAFARARAILADLSLLQCGLLSGDADARVLRRLADAAPTGADDPGLADLLAHASLRAQVELARRGSAG